MKKIFMVLGILLSITLAGTVKAETTYSVGDVVEINSDEYYVINNNGDDDYLTLLKQTPLLYSEVSSLVDSSISIEEGDNGYVTSIYLNCTSNCDRSYSNSPIKAIVDAWANNVFKNNELKPEHQITVDGNTQSEYSSRLLEIRDLKNIDSTYDELADPPIVNLDWLKLDVDYWTLDYNYQNNATRTLVGKVRATGEVTGDDCYNKGYIRPVINVYKNSLNSEETADSSIIDTSDQAKDGQSNSTSGDNVKVENTLLQKSLVGTIIGLVLIGIGISLYLVTLKISSKKSN